MNYPYKRQKFITFSENKHVRHVSQVSDLRSLGPLVNVEVLYIFKMRWAIQPHLPLVY